MKSLSLSLMQKLYTVCDVAMNIVMSKSTTYSLESPKDPVLPARYFTQPDKVLTIPPSARWHKLTKQIEISETRSTIDFSPVCD